jgi:hypothetical protein
MPASKMKSIKGGKKGAKQYEGLRAHGFSKERAAKIANSQASRRKVGKK